MKKAGLFLLILFFSCNFAWSQDTLYIYRAGIVILKKALNEVDSITFSKNYNLPIQQTVADVDGNFYHTVKIGTQTWMVENLKTTKYNDGTSIPLIIDGYSWTITSNAAYTWVNNDSTNKNLYGGIYNFYAASSGKLAPKGWHVPTKAEIDTLATYLGGYPLAGSKFKEAGNAHWISSNSDATNSSDFTALPAGYRSSATGDFHNSGAWGVFWSSTELDGKGGRLIMEDTSATTDYSFDNKLLGFSVRCIKDTQALPVLTTTVVSAITDTTAMSGGNITSDGGAAITARGICWSTSQNPTIEGYTTTTDSTGIGLFIGKITGLTADSTYYIRAYATNSVGTAYGNQVSFKTLKILINKSDLKFSITKDATNPNKFILKSLTPNAQPFWVTPVGISIKLTDTIDIPFQANNDTIIYSVETQSGIVTADPYVFDVTTIDTAYISGPMWTNLTGGLGKSKTWVLDLDANGLSKYFLGPFYYGGTGWEWDPAFKDIGWAGVSAGDYGTMTFDLIGNANFKSDNKMFPEYSGIGKFMLFPSTSQLITFGAQVLHDKAQGGNVLNWNTKMTIKTLDADHMQLIALSGPDAWYIYNYISKSYYDSH
jgi:uncharacterized protein (TIGR02145 family)